MAVLHRKVGQGKGVVGVDVEEMYESVVLLKNAWVPIYF